MTRAESGGAESQSWRLRERSLRARSASRICLSGNVPVLRDIGALDALRKGHGVLVSLPSNPFVVFITTCGFRFLVSKLGLSVRIGASVVIGGLVLLFHKRGFNVVFEVGFG